MQTFFFFPKLRQIGNHLAKYLLSAVVLLWSALCGKIFLIAVVLNVVIY